MSHFGEPRQIVSYDNKTKKYVYHKEILENLLSTEDISDCYVSVISIAGAFRKGKSFLLSFLLRYCNEIYKNGKNENDWMGGKDVPLIGFSWRGGSRRDTTGIWIWSKIFKYNFLNGDKICILLMDTQGTFDNHSAIKENAKIFGFSTMCSSVQIFNLFDNIQETDLNHLELFAEHGKLAMESTNEKAFQQLLFLVRDWRFNYESPYGPKGGQQVLDEILKSDPDQSEELENVRRNLKQSFEKLSCFLMPHPGSIATKKEFSDGKICDLSDEFVTSLKELISMVLYARNLQPKKIKNEKILAKNYLELVNSYWDAFNSDNITTIFEATSEINNFIITFQAVERYENKLNEFDGNVKYVKYHMAYGAGHMSNINEIMNSHLNISMEATKLFTEKSLTCNEHQMNKFYIKLEENFRKISIMYIEQIKYQIYIDFNEKIINLIDQLDNFNIFNHNKFENIINDIKVHLIAAKVANDKMKQQIQRLIKMGATSIL